eukprot:16435603-Heterocapsa_arctica.AAC.1
MLISGAGGIEPLPAPNVDSPNNGPILSHTGDRGNPAFVEHRQAFDVVADNADQHAFARRVLA